jgi:hypothetical protein
VALLAGMVKARRLRVVALQSQIGSRSPIVEIAPTAHCRNHRGAQAAVKRHRTISAT